MRYRSAPATADHDNVMLLLPLDDPLTSDDGADTAVRVSVYIRATTLK
jgi:hypothetical protein